MAGKFWILGTHQAYRFFNFVKRCTFHAVGTLAVTEGNCLKELGVLSAVSSHQVQRAKPPEAPEILPFLKA